MARRKISQVEAWSMYHKLARLERQIEQQRHYYAQDWPEGKNIANRSYPNDESLLATIRTARLLGHAVVVTSVNASELRYYAMSLAKDNS